MSTLSLRKIKHDSSSVDNITLASDGSAAFPNGATITPIVSSIYAGNPSLSGGSNWFSYNGDYFGAEIAATHKLVNGKTYAKVEGRLPTAFSAGSSNPGFWVLIVSHPTGTPSANNALTVIAGWKFRLPNGNNGDIFTFDFDNALESFGSAKIPATGHYYIGWANTVGTGTSGGSGSWWVDSGESVYSTGTGTVFYKGDPGPIGPTTYNSYGGNLVAKGMHWRFYEKPDYVLNGANTIKADKIEATHSIRVNKRLSSVYELVNHTSWTSSTSAVYIPFQPGLYSHYKLFWNINHGPSWEETRLRFCDENMNPITANYYGAGYWYNQGNTSAQMNSSPQFGANVGHLWLAGNGVSWQSSGEAVIYTGDDYVYGLGVNRNAANAGTPGNRFPTMRNKSILYGDTGSNIYTEESSGSYYGTTPVAGFVIYGSGGASRLGSVSVYGARYE